MSSRLLALLLVAVSAAYGADREFDRVVKAIEKHYGVKRTHVPLMGVANLFVKVAHPAGTSGFKLAMFEDLPSPPDYDGQVELDRVMDEVCRGGLHALVVTHSRRDGESSYVLAGEIGKSSEVLIATFERHEATVIQVTVNMDTLLQMIGTPDEAHRMFRQQDGGDDGR
jgi:hypothetical protein